MSACRAKPRPEPTAVQSSGAFTRTDQGGYHPALGQEIDVLRQASSGEPLTGSRWMLIVVPLNI